MLNSESLYGSLCALYAASASWSFNHEPDATSASLRSVQLTIHCFAARTSIGVTSGWMFFQICSTVMSLPLTR